MKAVSYSDTQPKEVVNVEGHTLVRPYYGKVQELCEGPQTFLVNKSPGSKIPPHFHDVDQFQVVMEGEGWLGKDRAEPMAFHYADAYTPYGPIVSGEVGLCFYTIRAGCAGGHFGMPASRHLIPGKPGRILAGKFETKKNLPADGTSTSETLVSADDGVAVVGLRLGPGAQVAGIPVIAGAQYYIVGNGSVILDQRELPRLAMILVEPGDAAPTLVAGPAGAEVLVLQFPKGTDRPGSQIRTPAERGLSDYRLAGSYGTH